MTSTFKVHASDIVNVDDSNSHYVFPPNHRFDFQFVIEFDDTGEFFDHPDPISISFIPALSDIS